MKTIKINFIDFWDINKENNIITNILKQRYNVEISDNPDYIFCSVFGYHHFKYNDAIKILVLGENLAPDFNLYDYAIGFYNIKFDDRYLKYNILLEEEIYNLIKSRKTVVDIGNKGFCAFVYRKNVCNSMRENLFNKLNEYKKVDSGGFFLNNIGGKIGNSKIDKINFQKKYKFVTACENQQFPEYNTEKILDAFASNAIPIYWGDPKINEIYNEKSFINCNKFENLDEVLTEVKKIDNDDEKYIEMLNEPIFKDEEHFNKQQKRLKDFLYNIFDKDKPNAKMVEFNKNYYSYKVYIKYFIINWFYNVHLKLLMVKKKIKMKRRI